MSTNEEQGGEIPPSLGIVPTIYPTSPPVDGCLDVFWDVGPDFDSIEIRIGPPDRPLTLLECLGPSPFERAGFPLIGFLATTYDKVSRYTLERGSRQRPPTADGRRTVSGVE